MRYEHDCKKSGCGKRPPTRKEAAIHLMESLKNEVEAIEYRLGDKTKDGRPKSPGTAATLHRINVQRRKALPNGSWGVNINWNELADMEEVWDAYKPVILGGLNSALDEAGVE